MEQKRIYCVFIILPSAARGALFEKTTPLAAGGKNLEIDRTCF